jgi:aspartate/methionine/tyrosine aminotransferase
MSFPMPRPTRIARHTAAIGGSVFSPLAHLLAQRRGPIFPLHVGDTWMEPFEGGRMEDLAVAEHPGMHRYCETRGIAPLVDAIVEKVRSRNRLPCERESVLVAAGATGALASAISQLTEPGEEVLILAPFWPLIRGIVQAQRATPVEVPFYDRVDSPSAAVEAVEERLGDRSVALYLSTPSNPTARLIPRAWLEALAELARRRDLWLLSDEVYEDFVYQGEHCSIGQFAPERTLSVYSFSKAYGMAGNRVGYLVGPPTAVAEALKVSTHTSYHAPTAGQIAALRALESGGPWLCMAREAYRAAGEQVARILGVPPPEGSCFLFLDVRAHLRERKLLGFLEDCLEDGVVLSPGSSSGQDYPDWVRLCFTAAPPDRAVEAARLLAKRLGRG